MDSKPHAAGHIGQDLRPRDLGLSGTVKPFCTPPKVAVGSDAAFDRFVQKAESTVLDVGEYRVPMWHFAGGDRGTVVCAHGWAVSSAIWRLWLKPLQKAGFSVAVFDAPAHGRATGTTSNLLFHAAGLRAVAERCDDVVGLVGHSLGGMACAVVAAQWGPDQARTKGLRLALLSAPAHMQAVVDEFQARFGLPDAAAHEVEEWIVEASGLAPEVIGLPLLAGLRHTETLALHAPEDPEASFERTAAVLRPMPHVTLVETPGLGHERIVVDRGVIGQVVAHLSGATR